MRLFLYTFNLVMFLSLAPSHGAILVSGDFSPEDQEKIDGILRTYTGPSPRYLKEEPASSAASTALSNNPLIENVLLNKQIPFAEIDFLRKHFAEERLKATVAYVPATVWSLFVTRKYLTDKTIRDEYRDLHKMSTSREKETQYSLEYRKRYFDLSLQLTKQLPSEESERNVSFFVQFSQDLLEDISRYKSEKNPWTDSLEKEGRRLILQKMIKEEYEASEKNEILLVRATAGLSRKNELNDDKLKKLIVDFYEEEEGISPTEAEVEQRLAKYKSTQKYKNSLWYSDFDTNKKVLDFPVGASFLSSSAWEAIFNFKTDISEHGWFSKSLSFADGILSGFLFDSFNRSKSACSFVFYDRNPNMAVYTLRLDKKWLFSKGLDLFHFGAANETDGIFGSQEVFHPRLRAIIASSHVLQEYRGTVYKTITTDFFNLDPESPYRDFDTSFSDEMKKISQFVLTASGVLAQAQIVSLNGVIEDEGNYSQGASAMLSNQKELPDLLYQRLRRSEGAGDGNSND